MLQFWMQKSNTDLKTKAKYTHKLSAGFDLRFLFLPKNDELFKAAEAVSEFIAQFISFCWIYPSSMVFI